MKTSKYSYKIFRIKYNKLEYHQYVNYICICSTNEGIYILLQFHKKVQVTKKSFFEIVLNNELIEATCFTARDTDLIKNEMMLLDDFFEHGNYKSNSQRVIQHLRFLDKKEDDITIQIKNIDKKVNDYFSYDDSNINTNASDLPVSNFINEKLKIEKEKNSSINLI